MAYRFYRYLPGNGFTHPGHWLSCACAGYNLQAVARVGLARTAGYLPLCLYGVTSGICCPQQDCAVAPVLETRKMGARIS